ncbi:hypothetical protein GOM49_17410 [Clostridium bovifaecis]|uniref:Uncharacterized protein n=1 Tax=Clostridium bovifaecis TaxID=2184719 RepID=A0A6I6ESL1_9CLOT|nr:hypothetical protein GOM49_17410 [Clostridium bovifaecis]
MNIFVYIVIVLAAIGLFVAITNNPMDDSGEEFNPNIFPFEIKDPKDWCKPRNKDGKK